MLRNSFDNLATSTQSNAIISQIAATNALSLQENGLQTDLVDTQKAVLNDPTLRNGDEPVSLVAMHPDFPITLDPGQTVVVGGKTKGGQAVPQSADINGAQILSDAPAPIFGTGLKLGDVVCWADTQGYPSLTLQVLGTWAGTITFQMSNDNSTWVTAEAIYPGASALISSTTSNNIFMLPAGARYLRAYISTYTSGVVVTMSYLRSQLAQNVMSLTQINIGQIGGNGPASAGQNGMLAVGGNIAAGTAPNANPVLMGGIDNTGLTRRVLTTVAGAQGVAGFDSAANIHPLLTDASGALAGNPTGSQTPLQVKLAQGSQDELGVTDALAAILRELRYMNYSLQEQAYLFNSGKSMPDDGDSFKMDPILNIN
jgi:hypothetical protein